MKTITGKEIKIGQKFTKKLNKGKSCECEVVDIIQRVSTKTGEVIALEYWAKSETYFFGKWFEVAKNTILLGK